MVRKTMAAALVLVLGLSAAGCGNQNTGASASRWDTQNDAQMQQGQAWGTLEDRTGLYRADADGQVDGYHRKSAEGKDHMTKAGKDLKNAGKHLAKGAKDAAQSVGDAAEDTLDSVTGNTANTHRNR